ncbi:sugar phosphate isomerase family [Anoxybacteroides rupiense]|uniref:hypothetical protein n=1 Tax=Anoxybacteroides rupiense TaxID=311460 RepID=UPI001F096E56|nr:hypothetical protein [Anoxybacillus rupiensis]
MKIIEVRDYKEMSQKAAEWIIHQVRINPHSVLGLATGGTMLGTYAALVEDYRNHQTTYRHVHTVNLDEYIGLDGDHPNSYRYYMNHHFFHFIDIPSSQTHIPNGLAEDVEAECQRYEAIKDGLFKEKHLFFGLYQFVLAIELNDLMKAKQLAEELGLSLSEALLWYQQCIEWVVQLQRNSVNSEQR